MATTLTWQGGSLGAEQGRWEVGSDWSTGAVPVPGDLDIVNGVANAGIGHSGEVITFPFGSGYTQVYMFPKGASGGHGTGYSILQQTIDLNGTAGPPDLVLQGTLMQQDVVSVTGTVVLDSYLDNDVGGIVSIGGASGPGVLQFQIYGVPLTGGGIGGGIPATTLGGHTTITAGSQLRVIAVTSQEPADNFATPGTITVQAGGTLFIDDTDGFGIITGADNNTAVLNTGTILLEGGTGRTTTGAITANTVGSGTIDVAGNGAPQGATMLTLNGNVTGQHITVDDGTVAINDAQVVIGDPSQQGFAVTGGSFTFGVHGGTLLLHQPPLTTLQFIDGGLKVVQLPDGQHPFTTPIYGFGAGDAIGLVKAEQGETFRTVWDQTHNLLSVEFGNNPEYPGIQAQFRLEGSYQASGFHLAVDSQTQLVTLTYGGAHG